MRVGRVVGVVLLIGAGALLATLVTSAVRTHDEAQERQTALQPFYTPPDPLPIEPGTVIRSEPLGVDVEGGTAQRILYVSQRPDGTPVAASAMLFVPTEPAPEGGRPVVAWAHGTTGMGDACAPSRTADPTSQLATWLTPMLRHGWVVVATDYAGLGTPGQQLYLVGDSEARDVVNSVRAARNVEATQAGTDWVVYGHSQGGHSALWTAELAATLAPELRLLGVAAAAPAAELTDIMQAQSDGPAGWILGPEVVQAWTSLDPKLPTDLLSDAAREHSAELADKCVDQAVLEGLVRDRFQGPFFTRDPMADPAWAQFASAQTPAPLSASMPTLLIQSTADGVVLAWPNAKLQEIWCAAGSDLATMWLGKVGHGDSGLAPGPAVVTWAAERFDGLPNHRDCQVPPPIAAEPAVPAPPS